MKTTDPVEKAYIRIMRLLPKTQRYENLSRKIREVLTQLSLEAHDAGARNPYC